jgi:Uma2 family endonuclease
MTQPAVSPSLGRVCYEGPPPSHWDVDETTPVPEARPHDQASELMRCVLDATAAERLGRPVYVPRNLALRFDEARPKVGLDPDVALYEPPPPDAEQLSSVRTWEPGHTAPKIALEVVSAGHPNKDYGGDGLTRYAASGTGELWVFDPLLVGPREGGGPYGLQVWVRVGPGQLERVYAGPGPCWSPYLGAWLVVVEGGRRLRLSDDAKGRRLWPTAEEAARAGERAARRARAAAETKAEAERAAKEAAEAKAEAERAAKDEALTRLARLEAELAALRRGG